MAVITKVIKVPIRILEEDESLKNLKYRALDEIMNETRYIGNMAIRYYLALSMHGVRDALATEHQDKKLDTFVYDLLKDQIKFLSAGSMATLARNNAAKLVKAVNKDAWAGRKSLPTYRSKFAIFRNQGTSISALDIELEEQFMIRPSGFQKDWLKEELVEKASGGKPVSFDKRQEPLALVTCLSRKDSGARAVLGRIVKGEYKLCDSQIQRGNKGLMALLSYKFEPAQPALDPAKVCGIDLGYVIPAVCAINYGPQRLYLGNADDVWAARSKFRAERRRQQKRLGMYTKTKQWTRSEKEDRWIETYYHTLTRQIIKFCLQHDCGTIQMEDLADLRQKELNTEKSDFKRIIWVPSKFHAMLEPKAQEAGITVVRMNPRNTSRRCSVCGHIDKASRRDQKSFVCTRCGDQSKPLNADYNAAKNIALAAGEVLLTGYLEEAKPDLQAQ